MRPQLRVIRFRDDIGRVAKPAPRPKTPTELRLERNIRRLRAKVRDQKYEINMLARELSSYMNFAYNAKAKAEARLNRTWHRDNKRWDEWRRNINAMEQRRRDNGMSWENDYDADPW